jgi:hypothetical protein
MTPFLVFEANAQEDDSTAMVIIVTPPLDEETPEGEVLPEESLDTDDVSYDTESDSHEGVDTDVIDSIDLAFKAIQEDLAAAAMFIAALIAFMGYLARRFQKR